MADFSKITARLFTGAAISSPDDVTQLKAAGVTHVLDLRDDYDDGPLLAQSGLIYLWNGTPDDGSQKPPQWWEASLTFALNAYRGLGSCLYAHCAAGVNRGPSTAYAVMRACWGIDSGTVAAMIRTARPQVGLAYAGQFDAWWPPPQWW